MARGDPRPPVKADLDEVERALSILDGRHPDHARATREAREAAERKRAQLEREAEIDRRRWKKRAVVALGALAVAGVAAGLVWRMFAARAAIDAAVAPIAAPFQRAGFVPLPVSIGASATSVDVDLPAGTCAVAIAADGAGALALTITRDGATETATGSFGWCTCVHEHAAVRTPDGPSRPRGARIYQRPAASIGGRFGLVQGAARPATVAASACAEDHLDAWLAARPPPAPFAAPWLDESDIGETLRGAGFRGVATATTDDAFVDLALPDDTCALVLSTGPHDALALRAPGGARLVEGAHGALAACAAHARRWTVWREGAGRLAALVAPSARVGGTLGMRDLATRAGFGDAPRWLDPADLRADAAAILRGSSVLDVLPLDVAVGAAPNSVKDARIVALSMQAGATVAPDASRDAVFFTCEPALGAAESSLCVQAGAPRWRDTSAHGRVGAAQAALPFWMNALTPVRSPEAVKIESRLLALARRLTTDGFSPSVLEAVTELDAAVDVQGRAGEDAIVAIGLEPQPPYAHPYGRARAAPWALDAAPQIIPLAAGAHVVLASPTHPTVAKEARRTVVFRHAIVKRP